MDKISLQNYQVEDFISDESFINYYFKSNKNDRQFWEDWLAANPARQPLVKEAMEMLATLSVSISEKEYQEELKKITAAIDKKSKAYPVSQLPSAKKLLQLYNRKKRTMQYLLPFLLVLFAGGYWLLHSSPNAPVALMQTANNGSLPMVLILSDSSIVSLAPHSYLEYPAHFDGVERNVYLHGNAQFTIKRNVEHPFKVHAENIIATVLGTTFTIKNSGDSAIEVELYKGKLNVEIMDDQMETKQSVLLDPEEKAVYVRNVKHLYKAIVAPQNLISFRQNNFQEIARRIKSVFGVTVINESNNKAWSFTGTFKNSTAKDIIENICLLKKLSFVTKGDTIVIK